jgi:hypothetical protein
MSKQADFRGVGDDEARLRARIHDLEREGRDLAERCSAAERHVEALSAVNVAISTLHETVERERVIGALHDIALGMGCEGLAVLEASAGGRELVPSAWRGVSSDELWDLAKDELVLDVAREGESFVAEERQLALTLSRRSAITACLALTLGGRPTGVLVLLGMRANKSALLPVDRVLLGVLETHAAAALYASLCYQRDRPTCPAPPR